MSARLSYTRNWRPQVHSSLCGLAVLLSAAILAGCHPQTSAPPVFVMDEQVPQDALVVSGSQVWTDTHVDVTAGQAISIVGHGRLRVTRTEKPDPNADQEVGPKGTFLYGEECQEQQFPLAAGGRGPAPCFCLIGRVGFGLPFFVGDGTSFVAKQTGRLYLGVNDYDPSQNLGDFFAEVRKPGDVQPVAYREAVTTGSSPGAPRQPGSVVVFYVDGLRPDILEEMAAMHHVPHLKKHFIDGGTYLCNTFTAFPSDTITSNGTMWTGCFSDRHGLKGQVRYSRRKLDSDSFLEPLGPNRSSRTLGPQGIDKFVFNTEAQSVKLVKGQKSARKWRKARTSGTPAIYDYLRQNNDDWATGVLPIMTDMPPVLWTRSMTRSMPYFKAQQAWRYIDDANAHYATQYLLAQQRGVTIIWLPETDSISHKYCRGQFGTTRSTIVKADKLVGKVTAELEAQGRLDSTYLVLVSDHGHLGGASTYLSRFDIANEFFYNSRKVTPDGQWAGGGLGMSVKQHRTANWHKEDSRKEFVFVDGDSDGAARVYLPRGHYQSRDWSGPNDAAHLLSYRISDSLPPVNLPETLAHSTALHDNGSIQHPIDLVLMKLDEHSILITTCDRGYAIIDRREDEQGAWVYRYTPVRNIAVGIDGVLMYEPVPDPTSDPLGLVERVRSGFLNDYHDEQTWLYVTATSAYPDSVVTLTRHMLWQENLQVQEQEYAPDLVVTARYGWLFGTQNTPGTTHGFPLSESMHATWYVSGPGVRKGARVETPCRLVDLTPTILELTGTPHDPAQLDGKALRTIYEPEGVELASSLENPLYWRDFDLCAWQSIEYTPATAYAHQPRSMNHPSSGWDMHSIAYNAIAIGDWSVFRLIDDIVSPLVPGQTHVQRSVDRLDAKGRHYDRRAVSGGVQAVNLPGVALADYSLTSVGNFKRIDGVVDWAQDCGTRLDQKLAEPIGVKTVLGSPVTNVVIDGVQVSFWEMYRFAQRVVVEVLDEVVLSGIEDTVDKTLNYKRSTPAEIVVPGPES